MYALAIDVGVANFTDLTDTFIGLLPVVIILGIFLLFLGMVVFGEKTSIL